MNDIPVDIAVLNELRAIMADEFNLLINVFISDSEQRIMMLEKAIAERYAEALRGAAHSFKGSSLNISAARLTEFCRQLEFMGRDNNLNGVEAVFADARDEFEVLRRYLSTL